MKNLQRRNSNPTGRALALVAIKQFCDDLAVEYAEEDGTECNAIAALQAAGNEIKKLLQKDKKIRILLNQCDIERNY